MDPMRGEVWDAQFPAGIGAHPVVVLTVNAVGQRLSTLTVVLITGTEGPPSTHMRLDRDAGLTGHIVSYVNVTDLHTLPKGKLRKQRGRLSTAELGKVEEAVRDYLGL
jgi:mRNA interferase MazF